MFPNLLLDDVAEDVKSLPETFTQHGTVKVIDAHTHSIAPILRVEGCPEQEPNGLRPRTSRGRLIHIETLQEVGIEADPGHVGVGAAPPHGKPSRFPPLSHTQKGLTKSPKLRN